jgi:NAD(P)-dependent dehydrogenase (short-subunit alcohol dehydrogenase family)
MSDRRGSAGEAGKGRRVALVTGGTRGIGQGIARALAREGWDLALGGLRPEEAVHGVLEELRGAGADVLYCAADIASAEGRAHLVDAAWSRHGRVNALVNNAGRAPRVRADLLEASEESFEEVFRANLLGPYFLTQRVARLWTEGSGRGAAAPAGIVFVTSVSAEMASPNRGEYCVSKAGLSMAARLFATRLAADGIPVYEVRPGIVATDMTAPVAGDYDRRIAEGLVPEGRWGTPEDVGRAVATLLRGDIPYASGTVVTVDGGLSIPRM